MNKRDVERLSKVLCETIDFAHKALEEVKQGQDFHMELDGIRWDVSKLYEIIGESKGGR